MAKKNRDIEKSDDEVFDNFSYNNENVVIDSVEPNTRKCKVIEVTAKSVCVDFCGYGISIEVDNIKKYKNQRLVTVSYSGKIGTPDFKIWVD